MKITIRQLRNIIRESLLENAGMKPTLLSLDGIDTGDETVADLGAEELPFTVKFTYSTGEGEPIKAEGEYVIQSLGGDYDDCLRYVAEAMEGHFNEVGLVPLTGEDLKRFLREKSQFATHIDSLCNTLQSLSQDSSNNDNYY